MEAILRSDDGPFDDVLKIAVLRGGGLGDLLFALPAIEALSWAYPEAEIVLLGTPLAAALLDGRPGPVARVETLPPARGVHGPDEADDAPAVGRFLQRMSSERFDLACQMHGGGRYSNPFLLGVQARHTVGTRTPDAAPLERNLPYVYYQHEMVRWRETAALAGAIAGPEEPHVTVSPRERLAGLEVIGDCRDGLAVLHPGATDPRRRWPADRFVELAVRLAADGMRVIVVGDGADAAIANGVAAEAGRRAGGAVASVAGRLTLPELAGVLSVADVFVGNDSGPRHLAQAVGAPTVAVYWVGNLINGGPLTRALHRVHLSWTTRCPVCGRDVTQVGWTAERCAHDDSFVTDVEVDAVYEDAAALASLMATTARLRGR